MLCFPSMDGKHGLAGLRHIFGWLITAAVVFEPSQLWAIPPAPTGVTIASGTNTAFLTWNATPGAVSYKVRRAVNTAGPYTLIASGLTSTSYLDTALIPDTAFFYVIAAVNASGDSPDSAVASLNADTPPGTPTGLVATPGQTS